MTAIEVAKLRLQCATAQRDKARFTLEDALRTEIPDDGRLVLLRRLRVAPAGSSTMPGLRQDALRDAWLSATGGARHGADDGARDANCVWFASREEAERVLVVRLLRGRSADAWFWKLALPEWLGRPVETAMTEAIHTALIRAEERRVLALVEMAIEAGRTEALLPAFLSRAASGAAPPPLPGALAAPPTSPANTAAATLTLAEIRAQSIAAPLAASLDPALRKILTTLHKARPDTAPAVTTILRSLALRHSPALALDRNLLERAAALTLDALVTPVRALAQERPPAPPPARPTGTAETPVSRDTPSAHQDPDADEAPIFPDRTLQDPIAAAPAETHALDRAPAPPPLPFDRQRSRHAGIWLVLPSLAAMDFPAWLAARSEVLGHHPARQLMLTIARHHRIAFTDPALAVFDPAADEILPAWAEVWCHGLDRWLRRTARRRLHDLVNRPGALVWSDLRLDVIFPLADADIRLRLRALDRDPGWVDWLGLSVRYQFAEDQRR